MVAAKDTIDTADKSKPATSDDDKAKAEAAAAAVEAEHPSKGKFVLYLGPANAARAAENDEFKDRAPRLGEGTMAEISSAQWGEAGFATKRTHTWDVSNDWKIPATLFTQDQIDYLLTVSTRFALVDTDGAPAQS